MPPSLLRRTLVGTLVGAALFGLVSLVRLWVADELVPGVGGPLTWFALFGGVTGGSPWPLASTLPSAVTLPPAARSPPAP